MKIKSLLFLLGMGLFTSVSAATFHGHTETNTSENNALVRAGMYPGYCQIELINDSNMMVRVYGIFDDNTTLEPFNMYPHEMRAYIHNEYNGYCHSGMYITIKSMDGWSVYSGYTHTYDTIHITPGLGLAEKSVQVKVQSKAN